MKRSSVLLTTGNWWFIPAGIALLIGGNYFLNRQELTLVAVLALGTGLACFVLDTLRNSWLNSPFTTTDRSGSGSHRVRWPFLAVAAGSGVLAALWASDNTFTVKGVIAWVIAVVAWLAAWWPMKSGSRRGMMLSVPKSLPTRTVLTVALVVLAVGIGAFFRFYHVDSVPLYPTSDHAEKLLDVTDVLNGKRPIFFERNTGREPTQFYFTAGLIRLFDLPVTFTTLKIGTAFVGTVAIIFIYLLAAEFAGRVAGISAAFLVAVSAWGTEISRAGLRFPYAMVAAAAVLWMLLRWMRTGDRRDALICGLFIGIGLYGYSPFRVVVPAVCLGLAIALITARDRTVRIQLAVDSLLMGATAAVFFIPLGRYAFEKPEMFWSRSSSRLTGSEGSGGAVGDFLSDLPQFLRNNWNALLGPNWRGDSTFVNAVTNAPMLDIVTGALLLGGLAAIGTHIARSRDPRSIFLVAAIPILLLSSTLSIAFPWENPSVNREAPVVPIVFTIAALPIALLALRLTDRFGRGTGTLIVAYASAGLIAIAATQNYLQYFHDFDEQTLAGVANTTEIAEAVRGGTTVGVALEDTYVIDWPNWFDIRNVGFELGNIDWAFTHNVLAGDPLPVQPDGRPMLLIVNPSDSERLEEIAEAYPTSYVSTYPAEFPPKSFITIYIPAE
jgi:hypothetical protein